MKLFLIGLLAIASILLLSCTQHTPKEFKESTSFQQYKIGDIVPTNEVCMVNNAYMGKKQLEVQFDGKTYYGCCEDCRKKIPNNINARIAIDPVSKKEVDKSKAIIAVTSENDMVSYFENKTNYENYFKNYK